jgi:hypothetical protein
MPAKQEARRAARAAPAGSLDEFSFMVFLPMAEVRRVPSSRGARICPVLCASPILTFFGSFGTA